MQKKPKLTYIRTDNTDENLGSDDAYDICEEVCLMEMVSRGIKELENTSAADEDKATDEDEATDEDVESVDEQVVELNLDRMHDDLQGLQKQLQKQGCDSDPLAEFMTDEPVGENDEERDRVSKGYMRSFLLPAFRRGLKNKPEHEVLLRSTAGEDGRVEPETVNTEENIPTVPVELIDLTDDDTKQHPIVTLEELQSTLTFQEIGAWSVLDKQKSAIQQSADFWAKARKQEKIKKEAQDTEASHEPSNDVHKWSPMLKGVIDEVALVGCEIIGGIHNGSFRKWVVMMLALICSDMSIESIKMESSALLARVKSWNEMGRLDEFSIQDLVDNDGIGIKKEVLSELAEKAKLYERGDEYVVDRILKLTGSMERSIRYLQYALNLTSEDAMAALENTGCCAPSPVQS
jgi:hypothetical protein